MNDQIDLSIILINWNAHEVTANALASLYRHVHGISFEIFVIDNGSSNADSGTELLQSFSRIRLILNKENRGFTKANNQGIALARGRYVLLLNNDTIQTENAPGLAVRYMDKHSDLGALGIMHRNNDLEKSFQPSFYPFPNSLAEILGLFGIRRKYRHPEKIEQDVDWVCGSFLLMRRECLNQIGPLDERFFIYDEDMDWCMQAKRAGWKVRFWPEVSMIHLGAAAHPFMRDKTLVMFRSHLSFLCKNYSRISAFGYYAAIVVLLSLASAKQCLRMVIGQGSRAEVLLRLKRQWNFLLLRPGRVGG